MASGRKADHGASKRAVDEALDDELLDDGADDELEDGDDEARGAEPAAAAGPARVAADDEPDDDDDPEAEAEAERFAEAAEREAGTTKEKPALLQAIEKLLADPEEIRLDVEKQRVRTKRRTKLDGRALDRAVADDLVTSYARRTMLVGGASALAGVIPGFGGTQRLLSGEDVEA